MHTFWKRAFNPEPRPIATQTASFTAHVRAPAEHWPEKLWGRIPPTPCPNPMHAPTPCPNPMHAPTPCPNPMPQPHAPNPIPTHRSEQLLEERAREHVPRDGVGDGGEDPVELPQGGLSVRLPPRDAVNELLSQAVVAQQAAAAEPAQSHLQVPGKGGWRRQAGSKVGRQLGAAGCSCRSSARPPAVQVPATAGGGGIRRQAGRQLYGQPNMVKSKYSLITRVSVVIS